MKFYTTRTSVAPEERVNILMYSTNEGKRVISASWLLVAVIGIMDKSGM